MVKQRPFWQTCGLDMNAPHEADPAPREPGTDAGTPTLAPEPSPVTPPREVGGRVGPEPTRYGDWEKAGRCIDF